MRALVLFTMILACGGQASPPGTPDAREETETGGSGGSAGTGGAALDAGPRPADAAQDSSSAADRPAPEDGPVITGDAAGDVAAAVCQGTAGAGSITDRRTCLTWQKAKGPPRTNVQAARACADLVLDGFSDWRVPAPEELATWPNLSEDSNAYVTNPTYIPVAAAPMDGCTSNAHSCNVTEYNAGSLSCAWQGVGFQGPTVCVRGTALAGTLATQYAASNCEACKAHVAGATADFKVADCLPYAP